MTRTGKNTTDCSDEGEHFSWLSEGLLISSFSKGLADNLQAQQILHQGLANAVRRQEISVTELQLADSVRFSPCNGPDLRLLETLERLEETDSIVAAPLRMIFIPTAMYARRLDSNSTIGKQRQRAKADARQRRNDIVRLVSKYVSDISVITVDFESGLVTHPERCRYHETNQTTTCQPLEGHKVPANAHEALKNWKPHFIYIQGGNTFWLHHCLKGYVDDLRLALESAFFCGASAGAIIAGRSVSTALWKGWDDPRVVPDPVDWNDARGLGLVGPYSCFPHYDASWEVMVSSKTKEMTDKDPIHQVLSIADHEVLHVDGTQRSVRKVSQ